MKKNMDISNMRDGNFVKSSIVLLFSVVFLLVSACSDFTNSDYGKPKGTDSLQSQNQNDVPIEEVSLSELKIKIKNYQAGTYTIYKVKGEMSNGDYNSIIDLIIERSQVWNAEWKLGETRKYYIGLDLSKVSGPTKSSGGGCLYNLIIPPTVFEFEEGSWLGNVTIPANNPFFKYNDGILYSSDESILYLYLPNKSDIKFVIPSSVVKVWSFAFAVNEKIQSITIPENITYIGMGAFENPSIKKLVFEDSENWKTDDGTPLCKEDLENVQNYCWSNETLSTGICRNGLVKQ